jgi:hypothetical protein
MSARRARPSKPSTTPKPSVRTSCWLTSARRTDFTVLPADQGGAGPADAGLRQFGLAASGVLGADPQSEPSGQGVTVSRGRCPAVPELSEA